MCDIFLNTKSVKRFLINENICCGTLNQLISLNIHK